MTKGHGELTVKSQNQLSNHSALGCDREKRF